MSSAVTDLSKNAPFATAAQKYRDAGWRGVLPLHPKDKNPEVSGFHGKGAPYVDDDTLKNWVKTYQRSNIGLRLAGIARKGFEVIGIDVDHYDNKTGYDQLLELEQKYGQLPATWISTARSDGKSGIRFFLVPKGFEFSGKAAKHIDICSKGQRYAAVWPSMHPDAGRDGIGQYMWHPSDGTAWDGVLPDPRTLPELPEAWLDFLTRGKIPFTIDLIDMSLTVDEMNNWAMATFPGWNDDMCYRIKQKLGGHKQKIKDDPSSHDKVTNAHWNLCHLAFEGHVGGLQAVQEFEEYWVNDVADRNKRGLHECQEEMFRSLSFALRKIKAKSDERVKLGALPTDPPCMCGTASASPYLRDFWEYDTTDDGNREHLIDLFKTDLGSTIRYVSDWKRWIIWDKGRWQQDNIDGTLISECWLRVKTNQKIHVAGLKADLDMQIGLAVAAGLPSRGNGQNVPADLMIARNLYERWNQWTEKSGSNLNTERVIKNASKRPGVILTTEELDQNRRLLGVDNGVLELGKDGVRLREAVMTDMITMNTNVPYVDRSDLDQFGEQLWKEFMDTFIPNHQVRKIIQIAMGYCLLGGNPERVFLIAMGQTSSGKSTFARVIVKALGEYAAPVGKTMFQGHKFKPSLTLNKSKRFVANTEFDNNTAVSTAAFKEITGGSDAIEVEVKGVDAVNVNDLMFTPLIATNEMPRLTDPDLAIERRFYILPFDQTIEEDKAKIGFPELLEKFSLTSIFKWMVEGYVMYCENGGLVRNEQTKALVKNAMSDIDPFSTFINECIVKHDDLDKRGVQWTQRPDWCFPSSGMYPRFLQWWDSNCAPDRPPSRIELFKRLRALGLVNTGKNIRPQNKEVGIYWEGIKLKMASVEDINGVLRRTRNTGDLT